MYTIWNKIPAGFTNFSVVLPTPLWLDYGEMRQGDSPGKSNNSFWQLCFLPDGSQFESYPAGVRRRYGAVRSHVPVLSSIAKMITIKCKVQ